MIGGGDDDEDDDDDVAKEEMMIVTWGPANLKIHYHGGRWVYVACVFLTKDKNDVLIIVKKTKRHQIFKKFYIFAFLL